MKKFCFKEAIKNPAPVRFFPEACIYELYEERVFFIIIDVFHFLELTFGNEAE